MLVGGHNKRQQISHTAFADRRGLLIMSLLLCIEVDTVEVDLRETCATLGDLVA